MNDPTPPVTLDRLEAQWSAVRKNVQRWNTRSSDCPDPIGRLAAADAADQIQALIRDLYRLHEALLTQIDVRDEAIRRRREQMERGDWPK